MQTSVFAQDAGLINFYANTGAGTVTGPAVLGSSVSDYWNPVTQTSSGTYGTTAASSSAPTYDAIMNSINVSLSMTGSQSSKMTGDLDSTTQTLLNNGYWALSYWGGNTMTINISGLAANTRYEMVNYCEGNDNGGGGVINWTDGTGTPLTATVQFPSAIPNPDPYVSGLNYAMLIGQSDASGNIAYTISRPTGDIVTAWNGVQLEVAPVPEPSTIALGVMGASALLFRRRKCGSAS
jgi:hypothetical protein